MPTIFAANESTLMLNGEPVEGVRSLKYRRTQVRENVYALGQSERIALVSGPKAAEGTIVVASTSPGFDALGEELFQITAQLRHGDTATTVTFDDCYLLEKTFDMAVGSHGESSYRFTATRVREEAQSAEG